MKCNYMNEIKFFISRWTISRVKKKIVCINFLFPPSTCRNPPSEIQNQSIVMENLRSSTLVLCSASIINLQWTRFRYKKNKVEAHHDACSERDSVRWKQLESRASVKKATTRRRKTADYCLRLREAVSVILRARDEDFSAVNEAEVNMWNHFSK